MPIESPSFFSRFFLAWRAFFRTWFDRDFATQVLQLSRGSWAAENPAPPAPTPRPVLRETSTDAAVLLMSILQREGRFIDFIEEDVSSFSDEEIGAAARVVHDGCRKGVHDHFGVTPIRQESEGAAITLERGFDPSMVRLTGNVTGNPPFRGTLQHRGWRVTHASLPKLTHDHDVMVLAPAEVEL